MTIVCREKKGGCELKTKAAKVLLAGSLEKINDFDVPGPGEYEVGGVFAEVTENLTILASEEMMLVYFGPEQREISDAELEDMENLDVAMFQVTSSDKEELEKISKLTKQLEPRTVVLVGLEDPAAYEKIGGKSPQSIDSLKISRRDLPEEDQEIFALEMK